jgi:glutamate synthase (ferredoxin)
MTLFIKHLISKLEHRGAVSADGRTGDSRNFFDILMIFFVFLLFQNERVCRNGFSTKKKTLILKDDFETAIRNQNLNIGWRDSCRCFKSWTNRSRKKTETSVYW